MIIDEGYPDGIKGVELACLTGAAWSAPVDATLMVAAYWDAIGVEATVLRMDEALRQDMIDSGEHDCIIESIGTAEPSNALESFTMLGGRGMWSYYALENPDYQTRYVEAASTVNKADREAIFKELAVIALNDCSLIRIMEGQWLTAWWPWVKNFYGESWTTAWGFAYQMGIAWMDEDLKAEMGF